MLADALDTALRAAGEPRDLERAVVEAAIRWLKDGLVPPLEDAVDALLAARGGN